MRKITICLREPFYPEQSSVSLKHNIKFALLKVHCLIIYQTPKDKCMKVHGPIYTRYNSEFIQHDI